jgi:hypothetical protein
MARASRCDGLVFSTSCALASAAWLSPRFSASSAFLHQAGRRALARHGLEPGLRVGVGRIEALRALIGGFRASMLPDERALSPICR